MAIRGPCLGNNSGMAVKSQEKRSNTRSGPHRGAGNAAGAERDRLAGECGPLRRQRISKKPTLLFYGLGMAGSGIGAAAAVTTAAAFTGTPVFYHPHDDSTGDQQQHQAYHDLAAVLGNESRHKFIRLLSSGGPLTHEPQSGHRYAELCSPDRGVAPGTEGPPAGPQLPPSRG